MFMANKNERLLTIIKTTFEVVGPIAGYFLLIPQELRSKTYFKIIAIAVLLGGLFFLARQLYKKFKPKSLTQNFSFYGVFVILFLTIAVSIAIQKNDKKEVATVSNTVNKVESNSLNLSSSDSKTINVSSPNNHIIAGDNNVVAVNGDYIDKHYTVTKLPARNLENTDIYRITTTIKSLDAEIEINYPENDREGSKFAKKIFDRLFDLGYTNVTIGQLQGRVHYTSERFTIKRQNAQQPVFNIIINPQQ
jgi:hypothetical protein